MGLSANTTDFTSDWDAAAANGTFASFVGAVWMKDGLEKGAPGTSGKWHVTPAPGGAGNNGGSFLSVTSYSQHPQDAFNVIKWLQTPSHQLQAYVDIDLFPSTPSIYNSPEATKPEPFFGGQATFNVFSKSAEQVKPIYFSPAFDIINPVYGQQLTDVATQGKTPDAAWQATIQQIKQQLAHQGYKTS